MIDLDEMQVFLPSYLNEDSKTELFRQLQKFSVDGSWLPYGTGSVYPEKLLQGDAMEGLHFITLPQTRIKQGLALILSNSCDIDDDNERKMPHSITYCPLVEKEKFEALVVKYYASGSDNFIKSAREQSITNIIYFPEHHPSIGGYYGLLDRISHQPRNSLTAEQVTNQKVFTLSNLGFYLFLIKISIHFTRIHEKLDRGDN